MNTFKSLKAWSDDYFDIYTKEDAKVFYGYLLAMLIPAAYLIYPFIF